MPPGLWGQLSFPTYGHVCLAYHECTRVCQGACLPIPTASTQAHAVAQQHNHFCKCVSRCELTCLLTLPVQDMWVHMDEAITLHCDVPFATPADLPITWMFAKDVSCTCTCKGVQRHSWEDWAWVAMPASTQLCTCEDYQ